MPALSIFWAKRRSHQGDVFLKTLIAISLLRFFVDFTREAGEQMYAGLAQPTLALASIAIALISRKHLRTENPNAQVK